MMKDLTLEEYLSLLKGFTYNQYCSIEAYKNTYSKRFSEYKNEIIDSEEIDFVADELNKIASTKEELLSKLPYVDMAQKNFEISSNKKLSFLKEKAQELGFLIEEDFEVIYDRDYSYQLLKYSAKQNIDLNNEGLNTLKVNPHPREFKNLKAYKVFERWYQERDEKTQLADMSYVYWKLREDNLLHNIKPAEYIDWLNDEFQISLSKLKQLHLCENQKRNRLYSTIKDLVQ